MTQGTWTLKRTALIAIALAALILSSSVIATALIDRQIYVFGAIAGQQTPDKITKAINAGTQAKGWTGSLALGGRLFVNPRPFYSPYGANRPGRRFI